MSQKATAMEESLELEELDVNLYRSKKLWKPVGARGVFGGQVVGLALAAAAKTVPDHFHVHSLHSYFLLAGDNTIPITFRVYRVRDGKSYITRGVSARQHGRVVFVLNCSFHVHEESTLVHQMDMPNVPPPESIKSEEQRLHEWLKDPRAAKFHKTIQMRLENPIPVDMRLIKSKLVGINDKEPRQMMWIRAKGRLPNNMALHHCVAAYCSDYQLLNTSLIPHGLVGASERRALTMITSLDHAMWFHAPYRADEWLLYVMESPRSISGRGYATGRIYTADGRLVISTAQEGVIRYTETPPAGLPAPGKAQAAAADDGKQAAAKL
ncbi:acyl-CoA thioesterase [Polyrhizophydium stewartii]|uniref:Acyl-CoA thioesterase n=1 Tax=Polyrhizophydium stewartii TaxID=2732419 RepID=A0ABR4N8P2_9FUNG